MSRGDLLGVDLKPRNIILIIITLILIITIPLMVFSNFAGTTIAEYPGPLDRVYGYRVDLSKLGIIPRYSVVIDEYRVLIVGSIGGIYGVAVLNVANPHIDPVVEDLYPLTGYPTSITTDGYPVTRIAVGSDKGEILLFKIDEGRITSHLYAVLGADFYIDKLFIARTPEENYKIIALSVEGGSRSYPCLNCYMYVLDEEVSGILRIGPKGGNATTTCRGLEGIQIQDISPLAVYQGNSYYWDASNILVAYIPQVISLNFNVSYLDEVTLMPIPLPNTLVEVRLTYVYQGVIIIYGVNADDRGVVRVPIPRVEVSVLQIELAIRNIAGDIIWQYSYTFNPSNYKEIPDEIPLPPAILYTKDVDTRSAAAIYGVPPFLEVKLDLLNLTRAPLDCEKCGSADFTLEPVEIDLKYMIGEIDESVKIVYVDIARGFLNIVTALKTQEGINKTGFVRDYIGRNTRLIAGGTYSDGGYLIAGLSDGRLRIYVSGSEAYRLRNVYVMGSSLLNLITIPGIYGYTYVGVSTGGVQVFRVEPYPVPVYRGLTSLYLTTPGFIYGDALGDLSTIVLIDEHFLTVIKNTHVVVARYWALTMDQFMAKDIELFVNMPLAEEVAGSIVEFTYPGGVSRFVINESSLILRNIIPGVNYSLKIYPSRPYVYEPYIAFTIGEDGSLRILDKRYAEVNVEPGRYKLVVNLSYKEFTIRIKLRDEITGPRILAPLDLYVDDKLLITAMLDNEVAIKILYGEHNIAIVPSEGFRNIYMPYVTTIYVSDDTSINITLERIKHIITIRVVDVYGQLISPLDVIFMGPITVNTTIYPPGEAVQFSLPYGSYFFFIIPHDSSIYVPYNTKLTIDSTRDIAIVIQRVSYRLDIRLFDRFGVIGLFDLYANETKIVSGVGPSVTVELPCGVYSLKLVPMTGTEVFYDPSKPVTISLFNDTSVTITLSRKIYKLRITVIERGEPVANALVQVYSTDTGELITSLVTDITGVIETGVPSGGYRVIVKHEQYVLEEKPVVVDRDVSEVVTLRPTIITLIWRYAPVIGILVGVGVAIYLAMKIRAIIAARLVEEEVF